MAGLINYIWQSTFCLFFFYGIYWCFLKNEKAFTLARVYILITPILALLFPVIEIPVNFNTPSISLENTNFYQVLSTQTAPDEIAGAFGLPEFTVSSTKLPMLWEITDYLFLAYLAIVLFLAARLGWQFIQLQSLLRKGWYDTKYNLKGNFFQVPTFGLAPIFSFFDKLFWDDTERLSPAEKNQIIKHEIEHIRQGHSFDVVYYQILSVLFWFNPAIHLMRSALVDTHEYLADEKVLNQIVDKENYKKLIIKIAFKGLDLPIGNYFIRSTTLKRILMMKKSPKINWIKLLMVLPLTGMLMGLVSMKTHEPIFGTTSHSNISYSELEKTLLLARDTLDVGIKVVKVTKPEHYEFISPLEDNTLTAQIGNLKYTFSNISNEQEYIKVLGMIDNLRAHASTYKSYEKAYHPDDLDQNAQPADSETWGKFIIDVFEMPEKEKKLKLSRDIIVEFVVNEEGEIQNPTIKRSFGGGLDRKVLDALTSADAPKWEPGKKDGQAVASVQTVQHRIVSSGVRTDSHTFFPTPPQPIQTTTAATKPAAPDDIFDVVQEPPVPAGGMEGWQQYLRENLQYPKEAKEKGIEGTVYVVFVVTKDGEIKDPNILRGIGAGADEEALRVLKNSPKWTPGKQRGQEVNVKMRLPIRFQPEKQSGGSRIAYGEKDVYDITDTPPTPKGGMEVWNTYFSRNLKYPTTARTKGIEGIVYVTFIVNKEGQIENPDILRGIGGGADEEVLRLFNNAPAWEPGKVDGEPVNARMRLPVNFRIDGSDKPREKIVGEGADHTLSEIVVTAYGVRPPTQNLFIHLEEGEQITYEGETYTFGEFERHLVQLVAREKLVPQQVKAHLSASPNLKVGKLKEFEKLLQRNRINKVVYRDFSSGSSSPTLTLNDKTLQDGKKPAIIIDGKLYPYEDMKDLDPNLIKTLTVLKPDDETLNLYGKAAINGVVLIELKDKQ